MKKVSFFIKNTADFLISIFLIVIFLPILILISLLIKLDSTGSMFYLQERVGKDGKLFKLYKFRTMIKDVEKLGLGFEASSDDPRITKIGRFLRRWCLDELPQLFNVLKSDMSLVGPRPTLLYQVEKYNDFEKRRLEVRPGMTGLAQVKGRNLLTWPEKIKLDIEYIDNFSLWLDFKIILATFKLLANPEGVYKE